MTVSRRVIGCIGHRALTLWLREPNILSMTTTTALTIRPATPADAEALVRLAQLDSQRTRAGDHVLAEADGKLVAAVALDDGATYADPFERTANAVALLHSHVAASNGMRRRRSFIPRMRPALAG